MPQTVKIDEVGFRQVFESNDGPVGKDLWDRAGRVEVAAKAQAGVDTGNLKRSIKKSWVRTKQRNQITVQVGSDDPIAYMHHEGTKPHVVKPKDNGAMRFVFNGQVVFAREIHDPGTKPNKYLSDNLKLAGGVSRVR